MCSQEIQEEAQEVSDKVPFSGQSPVATEVEEDEVANKNYKIDLKQRHFGLLDVTEIEGDTVKPPYKEVLHC